MPIVHSCSEPGCNVLTMGVFCVEHEDAVASTLAAVTLQITDHCSPAATPDDRAVRAPELIGLA